MANELAELKFDVDYKPSEIKILNEDKLAQLVENTAKTYENMVFSDDNIKEAKEARADLNKSAKQIDEARIAVKNKFNEPLNIFEKTMNGYKNRIKEVSDSINGKLTSYETEQKEIRLKTVQEFIEQECEKNEIDPEEISFDNSWLNSGSFTPKGKLVLKVTKAIRAEIQGIVDEKQRITNEKATVQQFAEMVDMDPTPYVVMIDKGISSTEIIETIKQAIERKKKAEENAERKRLEDEKAKAERQMQQGIPRSKEAARVAKRQAKQQILAEQAERDYKAQVEQQESVPIEKETVPTESEIMKFVLEIEGEKEALFGLNQYMKDHNIKFKRVDK
ncbi:DUF1351 domain-containing protein [Enterococcus olivae]